MRVNSPLLGAPPSMTDLAYVIISPIRPSKTQTLPLLLGVGIHCSRRLNLNRLEVLPAGAFEGLATLRSL